MRGSTLANSGGQWVNWVCNTPIPATREPYKTLGDLIMCKCPHLVSYSAYGKSFWGPMENCVRTCHSKKFELETQFVLEFLANNNILNRNFITNLGSILHRNPACGQVRILPRNLLFRFDYCAEPSSIWQFPCKIKIWLKIRLLCNVQIATIGKFLL